MVSAIGIRKSLCIMLFYNKVTPSIYEEERADSLTFIVYLMS